MQLAVNSCCAAIFANIKVTLDTQFDARENFRVKCRVKPIVNNLVIKIEVLFNKTTTTTGFIITC